MRLQAWFNSQSNNWRVVHFRVSNSSIFTLHAFQPPAAAAPSLISPQVAVGRQDATAADPDGRMPALDSSAEQLLDNFAGKGKRQCSLPRPATSLRCLGQLPWLCMPL